MLMRREIDPSIDFDVPSKAGSKKSLARTPYIREIPPDLSWLVRIAGLIGECFATGTELLSDGSLSSAILRDFGAREHDRIETAVERKARLEAEIAGRKEALRTRSEVVDAFVNLYEDWCTDEADYPQRFDRRIWRVTKNRRVHLAVAKSVLTVKADAARLLFHTSCRNITWAVLDSGIDSTHPAFKLTTEEHEQELRRAKVKERAQAKEKAKGKGKAKARRMTSEEEHEPLAVSDLRSRVVKTLDFTRLRELLDFDVESDSGEVDDEAQERTSRVEQDIAARMLDPESGDEGGQSEATDDLVAKAHKLLEGLRQRIKEGKDIDWQDLEDAIVVKNPTVPTNRPGTHVCRDSRSRLDRGSSGRAALAACSRTRRMRGVCPDINLIDVRVFREDGLTDEFELLAAIQFLRWMNSRAGTMQVHGANLSLSLVHEVRRFACGQTPICDECNEASSLGMVVVAAAGNRGFEMTHSQDIRESDSYKSVSITDPGNAEHVITVGATHRKQPTSMESAISQVAVRLVTAQ